MVMALDLGIAFLVFLSVLAGLRSGVLDAMLSLAAFVGGIMAAFYLPRPLLRHLPAWAQSSGWAEILLAVVLFLAAITLIRLLGFLAGGGQAPVAPGERALGGLVGLLRGVLLAAVLASLLVAFAPPELGILQSRALRLLAPASGWIASVAPDWLGDRIEEGWRDLGRPEEPKVIRTVASGRSGKGEVTNGTAGFSRRPVPGRFGCRSASWARG